MFELITTIWNYIFMILFVLIHVILLIKFLKSIRDALVGRRKKRGKDYVLITGCDSGFGYRTTLELNKQNVYVFAGCLTTEGVHRLEDDPNFNGHAFIMDVTKTEDIDNAKKMIEEKVKDNGLWAVINNAGILQPGLIDWQCVDEMQNTMNVNLWGAVNVTKTMIPLVKKSRGRFVNITSMGGRVLFLQATSYSMSKYALEAFSDGLRYEMKPWGVSVHIIEPGMFQTDILNKSDLRKKSEIIWSSQPGEVKQAYGADFHKHTQMITEQLVDTLASPNVQKVVNAVCHAVLSSKPKARYPVGYDAHTLWMAIATFPTFVGDFIVNFLAKPATPAAMKGTK